MEMSGVHTVVARMGGSFCRALICAFLAISRVLCLHAAGSVQHSRCPTGFVNMGDSYTDTGSGYNAFPLAFPGDSFRLPTDGFDKRSSNGRVVPDFLCLAFGMPPLSTYVKTTAFDYRHGVNFAVGGSTASALNESLTPFSLPYQVSQFLRLLNRSEGMLAKTGPTKRFLFPKDRSRWLYSLQIGYNDLVVPLFFGDVLSTVESTYIPDAVQHISAAIQILYKKSARNFMVSDVPAQGCFVSIVTFGNQTKKDSLGCVIQMNNLIQSFNGALFKAVQDLRKSFPDATISYFSNYNASMEIYQNGHHYGFNLNKTKVACCGNIGQSLQTEDIVLCGEKDASLCLNPDEYISWDGTHFTESYYRTISMFILSSQFMDHGFDYTSYCDLNFSMFRRNVTFFEAYGSQELCNTMIA